MTVLEKLAMLSENMKDEDFRTSIALEFKEYLQTKNTHDEIIEIVDNTLE